METGFTELNNLLEVVLVDIHNQGVKLESQAKQRFHENVVFKENLDVLEFVNFDLFFQKLTQQLEKQFQNSGVVFQVDFIDDLQHH